MTVRKRHQLNDPYTDYEVTEIYRTKPESQVLRTDSGTAIRPFQVMEHGESDFTATGSATIAKSFAFTETYSNVVYAQAHAQDQNILAAVTDVTQSSVTITIRAVDGGNVSSVSVTTKVRYQVILSD